MRVVRLALVFALVACGGAQTSSLSNHADDVDPDKDAIVNDRCPDLPEDKDGIDDEDGCPEHEDGDPDGDGIVRSDQCPDDPEDMDGFADADGCPEVDNDQDLVLDVDDLCPNDPEDMDQDADQDGCPE